MAGMGRVETTFALALAIVVLGCGGTNGDVDAAAADGATDVDAGTPPEIPWLPDGVPPVGITPCPDGWREVAEGDVTTCDPYPAGGALDCPDGEVHFPGEPGCAVVGAPCSAGDFPDELPADAHVVYVQPGATGGDGSSPTTPYGSVSDFAFGGLPTGTVVALSRGSHAGPVRIARGLVLWGACAGETVLTTDTPSDTDGVITVQGTGGEVRDLTVADSPRIGVLVSGANAILEGVVVANAEFLAIVTAESTHLALRDAHVTGTRSRSLDGMFGRGLSIRAEAEVSRVVIERNAEYAVFAHGEAAVLTMNDVVVRGPEAAASSGIGRRGLNVQQGATAELNRALIERNFDAAVFVGGDGAAVAMNDAVVRDVESAVSDGLLGRGLDVEIGAIAEVSRVLFDRIRAIGVFAGGEGASVAMSDVIVRDTGIGMTDATNGRALSLELGGFARLERAVLERSRNFGIFADGGGTGVTMSDVVVRDGGEGAGDGPLGRGLSIQLGVTADARRVLFDRNREVAIFASDESTILTMSDAVVRDTEGRAADGRSGRAMSIQFAASVTVSRAELQRNREMGVFVGGDGAELTMTDVVVSDTRVQACAATSCADTSAGHGVGSFLNGALSLNRFVVSGSDLCGVLLAQNGAVDLAEGQVRDNTIGVCLQVDPYDTDRLTAGVSFLDNGVNLQSTTLPVPSRPCLASLRREGSAGDRLPLPTSRHREPFPW